MTNDAVMVLTSKSIETMISEGGSGNWRANEDKIRRCRWVIAVRNRHSDWTQGNEEHGTAFLIGRVVGVLPSTNEEEPGRHVIAFDQYATLDKSKVWPNNHRNPVSYTSLKRLGIDIDELKWNTLPKRSLTVEAPESNTDSENQSPGVVLQNAKLLIAKSLSIDPSTITISIAV